MRGTKSVAALLFLTTSIFCLPSHASGKNDAVLQDAIPGNISLPKYPPEALFFNVSGSVTVDFTISEVGLITNTVITHSDPPDVFDDAVVDNIQRWLFYPAIRNCKTVASTVTQTFLFDSQNKGTIRLGETTVDGVLVDNLEPFQRFDAPDSTMLLELVHTIEEKPQLYVHPEIQKYTTIRPRTWWGFGFAVSFIARYTIDQDGRPREISASKPISLLATRDGYRNRPTGNVMQIRKRAAYTIKKWRFSPSLAGSELCQRFFVFKTEENGEFAIPDVARVLR